MFCIASGATAKQYVIYVVGNCLALLAMLWFKAFDKDKIRKSPFKLIFFTTSVYLTTQVGRWLISLCFSGGIRALIGYIGTDIISLLFAIVLMLILRNVDGMIEDQKSYLFRLQREKEEEKNKTLPYND